MCHKALTAELMERTLHNFLEELDPTKTYFLEDEVVHWTHPSEQVLQRALLGFRNNDFSLFHEIHAVFVKAIARRNLIESDIAQRELPTGVKSDEFKNLAWLPNEKDLTDRLLRIKALQLEATQKLGDETKNRFTQRIEKRRLNRELEITGGLPEEQHKVVLSYILKAATCSLDSHTNYFTPSEANQFMIQVQQRLFGIGAQLRDDLDGLSVVTHYRKQPCEPKQ